MIQTETGKANDSQKAHWLSQNSHAQGGLPAPQLPFAAAAAAKSLQSCPTLGNPIDGSPPGSPVPGIFQARTLEWGAIAFSCPLLT